MSAKTRISQLHQALLDMGFKPDDEYLNSINLCAFRKENICVIHNKNYRKYKSISIFPRGNYNQGYNLILDLRTNVAQKVTSFIIQKILEGKL